MKKNLLALLSMMVFLTPSFMSAQNLMQNGELENWPSSTSPDGWDKAENIFQESTIFLNGSSSARHESASGTQDFQQVIEGVVPGTTYTISYNFLDNDPSARHRIWSYWLSGGNTITNDEEVLRPGEYSEDNPDWQLWEVELTAPAAADAFRFEVRVYKQDDNTGGSVYYDDFLFSSGGVLPEPTDYPNSFSASASGLNINLSWTDASGAQAPSAYLILASDEDNIVPPVDGNFVSDDTDLSDGSGALNIIQGNQQASFSNLTGQTTYYFEIYPYTNGGSSVDYKNDGDAPADNATTENITIIEFMDFNTGWDDWTPISIQGNEVWENDNTFGPDNSPCAAMSGFSGEPFQNEDWLISPAMNLDQYHSELLEFYTATNFDGPTLEIKVSNEYSGGDPNSVSWDDLSAVLSSGSWEWTSSGQVDLSSLTGIVNIAFKYTSNNAEAATWEVDNVLVTGIESLGISETPATLSANLYPNPVTDYVVITSEEPEFNFSIFTVGGRTVMEGKANSGDKIALNDLEQGFYLVEITSSDQSKMTVKKILVNND